MKRDLISILDLTGSELSALIEDAIRLKMLRQEGRPHQFLFGKSLAMVFEKSSTRTRVSFETGMAELGGHALFLNPQDLQIGRGEEVRDTARVLSRYVSAVMIRAYRHESIEEFARYAAALAATPVDLGRKWLVALVPLQLALALCWLVERRRRSS